MVVLYNMSVAGVRVVEFVTNNNILTQEAAAAAAAANKARTPKKLEQFYFTM